MNRVQIGSSQQGDGWNRLKSLTPKFAHEQL